MAHQSLYRRYRPRNFAEVKGQDHVVTALRNAVAGDSAAHAYMFSGPRGTGKTSTARIFAKALNCTAQKDGEPCCECDSCLAMEAGNSFDLFELDAASNNGVEAIRDLVERTMVVSPGRTKVYILDEVHMLSKAASNALLKTLEEPPEHVRFVLATTDPQKVLPTIRSRTQHFEFRLLSAGELTDHARWVSEDADLNVDEAAIAYAVKRGRGSVRDTLSALDQVVAAGGVVERTEPVDELFAALVGGTEGAALVAVADAIAQGHDPRVLAEAFVEEVREAFLLSIGVDTSHFVDADRERLAEWAQRLGSAGLSRTLERIGSALIEMRSAADPRVPLEVALIQLTATPQRPTASADEPPTASREAPASRSGATEADSSELVELRKRVERLEAAQRSGRPSAAEAPPAPPEPTATAPPGSVAPSPPEGSSRSHDPEESERVGRLSGSADKAAEARSELRRSSRAKPPPPPPRRSRSARPEGSKQSAARPAQADQAQAEANFGNAASTKGAAAAPTISGNETPAARGDVPRPAAPAAESAPAGTSSDDSGRESAHSGSSGSTAGVLPDRDALVMAFGDRVVPQLKGVAKAIFSQGRFLSVDGGQAVFAVENEPTRERAERYRTDVEALLGAEFSTSVALQIIVDGQGQGPRSVAVDAQHGCTAI